MLAVDRQDVATQAILSGARQEGRQGYTMGKAAYSDNVTVVPVLAVTTLTACSSFEPSSSFSA